MTSPLIALGFVSMCLCAGLAALFLRAFYQKSFVKALVFKGLASLCFIVFGAVNCFVNEISATTILVFVSLSLGIIGDEVIALCQVFPEHDARAFIGGGSFFLCGHILYAVALFLLGDMNWIALVLSFVLVAALSVMYERRKKFLIPEMKQSLVLYLAIVIFMMAVATGVFFKRFTLGAGLFVLGSILFTVSDDILFAYKLGENPRFSQNIFLHVAYYLAQFAIAWSIALL